MPIDPSQVKWDTIDPAKVQWDNPSAQPQSIHNETTIYDPVSGVPISSIGGGESATGTTKTVADALRTTAALPIAFAAGASRPLATLARLLPGSGGKQMVQAQDQLVSGLKQATDSPYLVPAANLAGEITSTAPVGGLIAKPMASAFPRLAAAVGSGGFTTGAKVAPWSMDAAGDLAIRSAGGALTGGVTAGLINPDDIGTGAGIGAFIPVLGKALSGASALTGKMLRGSDVTPEVAQLAKRAEELGINIPADRIVNSKPMNAVAATLNYVPFSGRAATEHAMQKQMNTALSRTIGQETSNVSQAMRNAQTELGDKFDDVLKNNSIKVTTKFLDDLSTVVNQATSELPETQGAVIRKQFDDLISHAVNGQIEGQAAYNFKRTLDRIGQRNSPEAYYATQMRKTLMDGLNSSLPEDVAKSFQKTRSQYKNMLDLQNVVNRGAEGDVSIGKLAHLNQRVNPEVDEIANIASQFLKSRENPHGALQRFVVGGTAAGLGGLGAIPYLAGSAAVGRMANSALNSQLAKDFVLGVNQQSPELLNSSLGRALALGYKAAPVMSAR